MKAAAGRTAGLLGRVPVEAVLVAAVLANLALEVAKGAEPVGTGSIWLILQCSVTALALFVALARRDRLRLTFVLALGLGFALGSIAVHLVLGMDSDWDSREVYWPQGEALLSGHYPQSEYPPGAVVLFAFEALVEDDSARVSNALVMVPFQILIVFAIWGLRTTWSPWLATLVALWPLNAFHWEFRFDALPTALAAVGMLCAFRGRWTLAGVALGLGAAVKWTPGLVALGLMVWLLAAGRGRPAIRLATAAAVTFLAVHLPFLIKDAGAVMHSYREQSERGIIAESLPYLPLRAVGLARPTGPPWIPADVPSWADTVAVGVQVVAILGLLGTIVVVRRNRNAGIALAGLLPVVFLLTNRVFSPQFMVPLFAAWAMGAALLERRARGIAVVAALAMVASFCNAMVYPGVTQHWTYFSAGLFAAAIGATGWLVARALASRRLRLP